MASQINHEAIMASAGSGKTFQLAHRYIWLLANEVKPDRIIALTFSRKAAGEILDSIIKYLCEAASSEGEARQVSERIGKPEFGREDFLKLLRRLLESLHRLHIGTLDSFIVGVIRAFPMELGIPAAFQVLDSDGAAARITRQEVLARLFNYRYIDRAAQREFREAFKQATFGQEEKRLGHNLDAFIGEYRSYYQVLPTPEFWGHREMVWPGGSPWLEPVGDIEAIASTLKASLENSDLPGNFVNELGKIVDFSRNYSELVAWDDRVTKGVLFQTLLECGDRLKRGEAVIQYRKSEYRLSAEQSKLFFKLLRHVAGTELHRALNRTSGIFRILDQYEQIYDDMIRRRGRLTFDDAQYLLTESNRYSNGALISRTSGEDARLYIDYRLDCELDHWLLDEFQDTSDLQWEVLRNLADELLQDDSGQRSFFYVGDVKQAIYGWRGGNARLFGRILEQYGDLIKRRSLNTSFRSSKPIINVVNRVFGDLPEGDLPAQTISEWAKIWQVHHCQQDAVPDHGYATLLESLSQDGEVKSTDEDRYRVVAGLLKDIDPLNRGLSVGVLVRTNESGKEIVNFLRIVCRGMNIIHEGRAAIKDNPVVSVLLSLVKFAAHPGDSFAWRHLGMSPFRECFAERRLDRNNLSVVLLREIQASGFQAFLRNWGAVLEKAHPLDDFGRMRLNDLIGAANEFDASGSALDCNAFLHFIENYQLKDIAAEGAVRVMTIHQSKGLGFDVVILPDLQGRSMTRADQDFLLGYDPDSDWPRWALKMPRRVIARSDPVLASQLQAADEAASFDALCLLYVALTRAKRGLYIITSFPGKGSKMVTPAAFLKTQLAGEPKPVEGARAVVDGEDLLCLYETGDRDWYTKLPLREPHADLTEVPELPGDFRNWPSRRHRLSRVQPSVQEEREWNAGSLFEQAYRDRLNLGTAMHELFAMVSWTDECDVEGLIRQWWGASLAEEVLKQKAIDHFRQALTSEEVRKALSRPEGNVELWREKRFEIVLDDKWVTGIFDRVTVVRDQHGNPLSATVLDFKGDELEGDADLADVASRYRSQLLLYSRALSRILQLDVSQVTLRLLFTHPGKVYDLRSH